MGAMPFRMPERGGEKLPDFIAVLHKQGRYPYPPGSNSANSQEH